MTKTYTLSNGKVVTATAKNKRVTKKFHGSDHYAYTIVLESDGHYFKTSFHDSVYNYRANKGATEEMINNAIYCIILDGDSYKANPNFNDFINEFGYDEDDKNGRKVYDGCKKTYECLCAMFTEDEIDSLYYEAYEKYNEDDRDHGDNE
jgi:hypothetical protein